MSFITPKSLNYNELLGRNNPATRRMISARVEGGVFCSSPQAVQVGHQYSNLPPFDCFSYETNTF